MPWFPNVTAANHSITSERSRRYNCIAWAIGDEKNWSWPSCNPDDTEIFWPDEIPREETIQVIVAVFATFGYLPCADGAFESEYERVAVYAMDGKPTHAAKQLENGWWSSKLGRGVDIAHELNALDGPFYGSPIVFLRRPRETGTNNDRLE
jgi:hypothetical protein